MLRTETEPGGKGREDGPVTAWACGPRTRGPWGGAPSSAQEGTCLPHSPAGPTAGEQGRKPVVPADWPGVHREHVSRDRSLPANGSGLHELPAGQDVLRHSADPGTDGLRW